MNEPRPAQAPKPQPHGAALTNRELHLRQRDLVRASLFARPATDARSTHRRWA